MKFNIIRNMQPGHNFLSFSPLFILSLACLDDYFARGAVNEIRELFPNEEEVKAGKLYWWP